MRRQRNMAQIKGQNKTPEKELNKMEISNLPDAEFKTLVIRMLRELIEYGKIIREEMKATLSGIKKNPLVRVRKIQDRGGISRSYTNFLPGPIWKYN